MNLRKMRVRTFTAAALAVGTAFAVAGWRSPSSRRGDRTRSRFLRN